MIRHIQAQTHSHIHANTHSQWIEKRCSCVELGLFPIDWTVLTGAAVLSFGCPWLNSPCWYSCVGLGLFLTEQPLLVQLCWSWAVPDWTVLTGTAVLILGCSWLKSLLVQLCWSWAVPDWTVLTGTAVLILGCSWLNSPYWYSCVDLGLFLIEQSLLVQLCWAVGSP